MGFFKKLGKKIKKAAKKVAKRVKSSPILSMVAGAGLTLGAGAIIGRLTRARTAASTPAKQSFLDKVLGLAKAAESRAEGFEGVADAALLSSAPGSTFPTKTVLLIGGIALAIGLSGFFAYKSL